jgi:hypothetical protein
MSKDGWERMRMDEKFHYFKDGRSMCGVYISNPSHPLAKSPASQSCQRCKKNLVVFDKIVERFQDDDGMIRYPRMIKMIIRETLEAVGKI